MPNKQDVGYGRLTNVEVYAMLSLALMEIKEIHEKLEKLHELLSKGQEDAI